MRRYFKLCVSTGGQTSKRSPFPVGLTVLNVNAEVQDAAGHICFVPVLDVHDLSTVDRTKANFLLRQGCINAVISRIEAVAAVGFTCRLPGFVQERRFRPFLCAMQLDSKETYAYAGCAPSAAVPGADYATAAPRLASQHPTTQRRWSDCGPPLTLPRIPRRVLWRVHGCAAMAGTKPGGVDCLMWPATAYCPGQQIQGP